MGDILIEARSVGELDEVAGLAWSIVTYTGGWVGCFDENDDISELQIRLIALRASDEELLAIWERVRAGEDPKAAHEAVGGPSYHHRAARQAAWEAKRARRRSTAPRVRLEGQVDITDDSGFLALVDPDAYRGFVGEDWQSEDVLQRFQEEMLALHVLPWGTGMENLWRVVVRRTITSVSGFREVTGWIISSSGRLLLTNYESLTMVAQFEDQRLPQPQERDQLLEVEPGAYRCRIVQLHNPAYSPENSAAIEDARMHFLVELEQAEAPKTPWSVIPWFPH